jgi:hypothetical protein
MKLDSSPRRHRFWTGVQGLSEGAHAWVIVRLLGKHRRARRQVFVHASAGPAIVIYLELAATESLTTHAILDDS